MISNVLKLNDFITLLASVAFESLRSQWTPCMLCRRSLSLLVPASTRVVVVVVVIVAVAVAVVLLVVSFAHTFLFVWFYFVFRISKWPLRSGSGR